MKDLEHKKNRISRLDIWLAVHHSITFFIIANLIHKFRVHLHEITLD
jgi:hypothetical protein